MFAEVRGREHAFELALHQRLPRQVMTSPGAKWLHQPRGGGRVRWVDREHLVGEKSVTGTTSVMKAHLITLRESAHQCAHAVWIFAVVGGMGGERPHSFRGIGQ